MYSTLRHACKRSCPEWPMICRCPSRRPSVPAGAHFDSKEDTMNDSHDTKLGPIAADIENLHQELERLFEHGAGDEESGKRRSDQQSNGTGLVIRGK